MFGYLGKRHFDVRAVEKKTIMNETVTFVLYSVSYFSLARLLDLVFTLE